MRRALLALVAAGCAGRASRPEAAASELPPFAAARWVPARPVYVLASPSVAEAQRGLRGVIDLIGAATGYDVRDAVQASLALLGVDALHADPVAAIGVDLAGGWALYGGEPGSAGALSPTLVVHLAQPAQMTAFLDRRRARGGITGSVIVDGVEVVSAALPGGVTISLAIDADWMWVHVAPSASDAGARWFAASHGRHDAAWTGGWAWAQHAAGAAANVVGLLDLHGALAGLVARLPDALACAKLAESVGRVSLAIEGDEHHVATRLALDLGSTERVRALLRPPPAGWDATAATAAIAAQWNLDLVGARPFVAPCLAALGAPVGQVDQTGVRAARAMLVGFDPDAWSGSGALALDLTSTAYLEHELDRIPLRRQLERARTFGPYRGHAISIPFSVTVEYVLEPGLAIAALGDGLLARLVAPAGGHRDRVDPTGGAAPRRAGGAVGVPTPCLASLDPTEGVAPRPAGGAVGFPTPCLASLDVAPPAMSAHAWESLIGALVERSGADGVATRQVVEHLLRWRAVHAAVTAEAGELVVTVAGDER